MSRWLTTVHENPSGRQVCHPEFISGSQTMQDQEIPKQVRDDREAIFSSVLTGSVHLELFPQINQAYVNEELEAKWGRLLKVRSEVAKALEIARKARLIGHSLEAHVDIFSDQALYTFLKDDSVELVSFFIVSSVTTHCNTPPPDVFHSSEINGLSIQVSRASGSKCCRCWNYSGTVGQDTEHPAVSSRWAEALRA